MNIDSTPTVQSLSADAQAANVNAVQLAVLKKALHLQASAAAALIQALPEPPPLATDGSLGTQVNTFA